MTRRRLTNLEPRQYPVAQAIPFVTSVQAAKVRVSAARAATSLAEMHTFFAMLGVAE